MDGGRKMLRIAVNNWPWYSLVSATLMLIANCTQNGGE
jgi:hypothetical protein